MVTDGAGEAVAPSQCVSAIRNSYAGDNTPLGSCNTNELREVARRWRARRCRGEGASRAMVTMSSLLHRSVPHASADSFSKTL